MVNSERRPAMRDSGDSFPLVHLQFRRAKAICKRGLHNDGNTKSSAQVERLVIPPVLPISGGLKPNGITSKKRPSPVPVRLSEEQKKIVRAKAHTAGLSVNEYIRASVLGPNYRA